MITQGIFDLCSSKHWYSIASVLQFKGHISYPQEAFYFLLSQAERVEEALSLMDLEELELKQKLKKLTENISDQEKGSDDNFTSDEDEAIQLTNDMKPNFASAIKRQSVTSADGTFFRTELSSVQRVRPHKSIKF